MRRKFFGFYRNIMNIFYIILITSFLGSCVQNGINQSENGYANLTIVISEMSRNWTITGYEVTVGTTVSEYQSAPGGVINLRLQIGTHNIEIKAKNSAGQIVYRGKATVVLTEEGTTVQIPLLQEVGACNVTAAKSVDYSVATGQPGAIVKYVITASSPGFADVVKEAATIGDSALFTDMFAGNWSFKIEGKAGALNADYTVKPNEWTTYISGTLPKTIPVNVIETLTLPAIKQDKVTPVISSVQSGTINSGTAVTLSCATTGATIKYKLDQDATADYNSPVTISSATTATKILKVYATKSGLVDSMIGQYSYSIDQSKTASPQFSVIGGTYTSAVSLTLTAESGASIYYTEDGTTPTASSASFTVPINISSGSKTIKAIAKHPDKTASDTVSHTYTIQQLKVVTPVITPLSGSYDTNKDIMITCGTGGSTIYYTTDGTTPTTSSTQYSSAFKLAVGVYTVKAFAKLTGYTDSDVVTANLTITEPVNGIKLHYKRPTDWGTTIKLHYWNLVPTATQSTWPGVAMTAEGNDWYGYTIANATGSSIIFTDKNEGTKQTGDLTRTSGEWWYKNGVWTDYDPEGPIKPVITATPASGTYLTSQNVTLTGNNITGDIIYYEMTTNGTEPAEPTSASTVYSSPINIPLNSTYKFKVKGYNEGAATQWGDTVTLSYTINPEADLEIPSLTASPASGKYYPSVSVSFTIKDNKSASTTAYWTTDGSEPTTSSPPYVTGDCSSLGKTGSSTNVTTSTAFKFLIIDGAGNQTKKTLFYNIGEGNDFREESIYFLLPTRFYDGDSTTNVHCWDDAQAKNPDTDPAWRGDFKGLIEKLDYIKALGFSAIWITPPVKNCSGYDYHGYHAINFKEIDPRYKTSDVASAEEAYQNFIAAAHAKGIKVIQDIVFNHSSNFGEENLYPMFKRNAPLGLNDTIASVEKFDPNNRLPENYDSLLPGLQYGARINAMKEDSIDTEKIYHHEKSLSWESYTVQTGQIAGDCVDLNTENPVVSQYLREAFTQYIQWGVDAFRVDTVKHISRLTFNNEFVPQLTDAGGEYFYMFGETCTRYRDVWNSGIPAISVPFYTWKEPSSPSYAWATLSDRVASVAQHWNDNMSVNNEPTSNNHRLDGNNYRPVDYSMRSRFDQIDFPMHWSFNSVGDAFNMALGGDQYYSDATWNVVYVDSHDYAPDGAPENQRYAGSWPEKLALIFTFRGIPCIFYGTEIEFQKGKMIDVGPNAMLSDTGRAYFGDHIEGTVTASDFGVYTASGTVSTTLSHDLAKHITRLNRIRRAIPALQKGQYSTEGVSGGIAFKRRYTNASEGIDSFALVTINGGATFSGIPNGDYKDCITGNTITVNSGSLTADCSGNGNARIYVLNGPGKIGEDGAFLK